jgi:hypothetical protein
MEPRVDGERARLAALAEDYEVPKKSVFRTTLGIAAVTLTIALVGVAAFFTRGASRPAALVTATRQPPPSLQEPALLEPPRREIAPLPAAIVPAPSVVEPAPTARVEKPVVRAAGGTAKARPRPRFVASPPRQPEPAPTSDVSAAGTTALPELKPPPEFGEKASDNPYADDGKTVSKASDNPYTDEKTTVPTPETSQGDGPGF